LLIAAISADGFELNSEEAKKNPFTLLELVFLEKMGLKLGLIETDLELHTTAVMRKEKTSSKSLL
jgi:hypothetical protein